ncbi:MarR family winged helix-turn-helix transcriptional regulator [Streptomyces sp. NPDC002596]|uniref:MarR family winged helix-turn-helix transcriptional regulator n=1 Tax=unclassified Streptomyces TaxID=2593676 RepID=UPI00225335B0|nr:MULTISPECIES: MarR family transcriptional regulator [unclassified Streptomyces]MCX4538069.1 MarR family transcriptional regulator [Streptomyces sp. NBC_01669]WSA05242.1 MarR family transcriptional regulator [Streptomyces sp. NBC_00841]
MPGRPSNGPSLLYLVKRLELAIRAQLDEMLRDSGVTTLQYTALTVLAHRDGISAAQLARDSFVTPQSMADMLRLLDNCGLIRREPNPQSKREVLVHISDAGRAFLRDYAAPVAELEDRVLEGLTPAEAAAFRSALQTGWQRLL